MCFMGCGIIGGVSDLERSIGFAFRGYARFAVVVVLLAEVRGKLFVLIVCCALIGFSPYLFFWLTYRQSRCNRIYSPGPCRQNRCLLIPLLRQDAGYASPRPQRYLDGIASSRNGGDYGQAVPAPSLSQRCWVCW